MSDLQLITKPDSYNRASSGAIWGSATLKVGEEFFPSIDWDDLVVAFAVSWLHAIVQITRHESPSERVHFMDGPFMADFENVEGKIVVDLVESGVKGEISRYHLIADTRNLLANAASIAEEILRECHKHNWRDKDITMLNKLKQEVQSILNDFIRE